MIFQFFKWDLKNILHIARHHVTPEEAEDTCYSKPFIYRTGMNRYCILGRTNAGRYLTVIVELLDKETVRVITARDMSPAERKRFYGR